MHYLFFVEVIGYKFLMLLFAFVSHTLGMKPSHNFSGLVPIHLTMASYALLTSYTGFDFIQPGCHEIQCVSQIGCFRRTIKVPPGREADVRGVLQVPTVQEPPTGIYRSADDTELKTAGGRSLRNSKAGAQ